MAQLNRSISFVAVAAAVVVAAAAVAGLDGLAAASQDYRSLGLFLQFSLCCSRQSPFCSLFPMCVLVLNLIGGKGGPKKIIIIIVKKQIFCRAFFRKTLRQMFVSFFHPSGAYNSSAVAQLHQEPLLLLQDL